MRMHKTPSCVNTLLSIRSLTGVSGTHQYFIQRHTTMAHRYNTLLAHLHLLLMLPTHDFPTICTTSCQMLLSLALTAHLRIQPCGLFDLGVKHPGHREIPPAYCFCLLGLFVSSLTPLTQLLTTLLVQGDEKQEQHCTCTTSEWFSSPANAGCYGCE